MSFQNGQRGISGLPLSTITAVVLDSETTGLDIAKDRMIELAAVRVDHGRMTEDHFSAVINPGVPIPQRSTEIHGIVDADVADAESFAPAMARFSDWAGHDVVMAYSIGFDIAVMRAEHERAGVKWVPPRCLDIRHLVKVVAPTLPKESLEITAEWLGIEITDRHRALGDAKAAAEVFLALIPKLKANNIVTLAQAERACLRLGTRLSEEAQAGWHDVSARANAGPRLVSEYARVDSFAYRYRVVDLMHAPPETIAPAATLRDALNKMMDRRISSVFVVDEATPRTYAIVTERDVLRAIGGDGPPALDKPVSTYAKGPLVTIESNEFVYRAITRMASKNFRHLGIVDSSGNLIGALSARDLLKQRAGAAMALGETIDIAATPTELGRIWASLTLVARGLVFEEVDPRDITAIVSRELRALTRRATQLAEQQLEAEGLGPAPCPYAMLVLGSGGRGESMLSMDQDNALIYAEGDPGSDTDKWFARLGSIVADTLNDAGVIYCPGGIMAMNDAWRMDTKRWRDTVAHWIGNARPEDLLNSDIFFDAVTVYGDRSLGEALRDDAMRAAKDQSNFINTISAKASEFSSPIGMFGRIKTDDGRVDLKLCGILPIFSAARVVALKHGIAERSTPGRLTAAQAKDVQGAHVIGNLIDAHRIMLGAIIKQQLRDIEMGIHLSNKVNLADLDSHEHQELKWALEQSSQITDLLGTIARF